MDSALQSFSFEQWLVLSYPRGEGVYFFTGAIGEKYRFSMGIHPVKMFNPVGFLNR